MKQGSTMFLRVTIIGIALATLALCICAAVAAYREGFAASQEAFFMPYLLVGVMYLMVIPFFIALSEGLKLLRFIDANIAFSQLSVNALKRISHCAVVIGLIWVSLLPLMYRFSQGEDAPGFMLFSTMITGASFVIAVFAGVLKRLLESAIAMKKENDLTV